MYIVIGRKFYDESQKKNLGGLPLKLSWKNRKTACLAGKSIITWKLFFHIKVLKN